MQKRTKETVFNNIDLSKRLSTNEKEQKRTRKNWKKHFHSLYCIFIATETESTETIYVTTVEQSTIATQTSANPSTETSSATTTITSLDTTLTEETSVETGISFVYIMK